MVKKLSLSTFILAAIFLYSIQNSYAHDTHPCNKEEKRTITISGEASVNSAPDKAVVDFTIETSDKDFKLARQQNAEISAKVLNGVRTIGLSNKNINLKNLNVNEWHEYDHKQRKSIKKGYKANRKFQVNIYKKDLEADETISDKVAKVVNIASESGITRLGQVSYGISDDKKLKLEALAKAVANAKEKANIMLASLGSKLGKIKNISENTYSPQPYVKTYARAAMMADGESSSIAEPDAYSEGEMTVSSKVSATFYIE